MKPHLLLLPLLIGCTAPDDDDSAVPDDAFAALALHGPFGGDATLTALSPEGEVYESVTPLGLSGTDWALGDGLDDFWLLGRFGTDIVRRYAWPDTSAPTLEFSVGSPTNPQVVRRCGGAILVTRYGLTNEGEGGDVAIYSEEGASLGSVDLSPYEESADGTAEPSSMVLLDDTLYVGLQRLHRDAGWVADAVGKVVAIDCGSRSVVGSWDSRPNVTVFAWEGGIYARGDGGVQRFDEAADAFVDLLLDADLPAPILGVAPTAGQWLVHTEDLETGLATLWCYAPGGEPTQLAQGSSRPWSVAVDPMGQGWVSWRDHWNTTELDPAGLARYDGASCAPVGEWVDLGSDPFDVAFTGVR